MKNLSTMLLPGFSETTETVTVIALLNEEEDQKSLHSWAQQISSGSETGCSQEEGPKKGFVMGSRTQGLHEILEKYIYRMPSPPQT